MSSRAVATSTRRHWLFNTAASQCPRRVATWSEPFLAEVREAVDSVQDGYMPGIAMFAREAPTEPQSYPASAVTESADDLMVGRLFSFSDPAVFADILASTCQLLWYTYACAFHFNPASPQKLSSS